MNLALFKERTTAPWDPPLSRTRKKKSFKRSKQALRVVEPSGKNSGKLFSFWKQITVEVAIVSIFLFGLFQGYLFFTHSPFLNVNHIEVSGNQLFEPEQLMRGIDSISGKNIFRLDLQTIAHQLDKNPWVRRVSVERVLPNQVRIHIEERKPYARIKLEKKFLMDEFGTLIAEETPAFANLPLIQGISGVRKKAGETLSEKDLIPSLRSLHYLNQLPFFKKHPVNYLTLMGYRRVLFSTDQPKRQIIMNLDNLQENFENLKMVLELLAPQQAIFDLIDLSFKDQVILKPGPSGRSKEIPRSKKGGNT